MLASINNAAFEEKSFEKETSIWTKLSIYIIVFALSPLPPSHYPKAPFLWQRNPGKTPTFPTCRALP